MPPILGEVADGVVNGFNRSFKTACSYRPGSLQVWLNGSMGLRDLADGWVELGSNKFRLFEAPREGDQVQVYYISF